MRAIKPYRFHVEATPNDTGLNDPGVIMVDQLRFLSKARFLNARPVGRLDSAVMAQVDALIGIALKLR